MTRTARPARFLVAGLGSIGRRHLGNLRQLRPDAMIAGLRRPSSAVSAIEGCDIQVQSVEAALAFRPDAAIIAGPAPSHVALARAFVDEGVGVLIEKPLSHDLVGLRALAEAAERTGAPVMIGYNLRYNLSLRAVRSAALGGEVGSILAVRAEVGQFLPDWRPGSDYRSTVSAQRALGGGVLLELSHEIDYLYWMFGMPDRVTCRGARLSNLEIDVEDCCEVCLEFDAPRRLISIHLDFLQRVASRSCKLIGTDGTLAWQAVDDCYVVQLSDRSLPDRTIRFSSGDRNQMYLDLLSGFLSSVETGQTPLIPLKDGIDVMRIVDAAKRSMESGRSERPVSIEEIL